MWRIAGLSAVLASVLAASADPPATAEPSPVAICVVGLLDRVSADREGLRHVAESLRADVFVFLIRSGSGAADVPEHLKALATEVEVAADPSVDDLLEEALRIDTHGTTIRALKEANYFFAHPLAAPKDAKEVDTGALQLRDISKCFKLVLEKEVRRRSRYRYVVYTRPDYYWFTTLPDLDLLQRQNPDAVWIPDGCDSDGLNDRMAVIPRRWAAQYLDRWTLLINGTLLPLLRDANRGRVAERGPEWLLYVVLRGYRVPVLRFTPVAALACTGGGAKPRHGSCTRPLVIGSDIVRFKYVQEASEAMQMAAWLSKQWAWRPARMPWMQPKCFDSVQEARACCNERIHGWGGEPACFNDVWYFWRCCGPGAGLSPDDSYASIRKWQWGRRKEDLGIDGVFVLPSVRIARMHIEEQLKQENALRPLCYKVSDTAARCMDLLVLNENNEEASGTPSLLRIFKQEYGDNPAGAGGS